MQAKLQSMESQLVRPVGDDTKDVETLMDEDEVEVEVEEEVLMSDHEDVVVVPSEPRATSPPLEQPPPFAPSVVESSVVPPTVTPRPPVTEAPSGFSETTVPLASVRIDTQSTAPPPSEQRAAPTVESVAAEHAVADSMERETLLRQLDMLRMKFKQSVIPPDVETQHTPVVRMIVERNLLQLKPVVRFGERTTGINGLVTSPSTSWGPAVDVGACTSTADRDGGVPRSHGVHSRQTDPVGFQPISVVARGQSEFVRGTDGGDRAFLDGSVDGRTAVRWAITAHPSANPHRTYN